MNVFHTDVWTVLIFYALDGRNKLRPAMTQSFFQGESLVDERKINKKRNKKAECIFEGLTDLQQANELSLHLLTHTHSPKQDLWERPVNFHDNQQK